MNMRRAMVLAMLVTVLPAAMLSADDLVATIEAEFLERFTRFIEWPASSSVADASVPFVIGVAGQPDVHQALTTMQSTKRFKGKTLEVREIGSAAQATRCQVVFVGRGKAQLMAEIVQSLAGQPVLLVADSPGFASRGAMINFVVDGDFVKFEVNPGAAKTAGLKMANELLTLGQVID